jgi:hypothetical protein
MFEPADAERLAGMAGHPPLPSMPAAKAAERLNDAFSYAITWKTTERRMSPPSERRDYLARVADRTAELLAALAIPTLSDDVPDEMDLHLSAGFRHLQDVIARMGDPYRDAWRAAWIAKMVAPDFTGEPSQLHLAIRAAAGAGDPDPVEESNRQNRHRLDLALERALLALPLLLDIAAKGREHWAAERVQPGERRDVFRRDLMQSLAKLYRDWFGRKPDVTNAAWSADGPAAHWVCEVVRIAEERTDRAPQPADTDDMPPESAADMIRALAGLGDGTLARYLLDGSAALTEADGKQGQDSPA